MLLQSLILFLLATNLLTTGCQSGQTYDEPKRHFHTVDYVDVGKQMNRVPTPYIVDVSHQSKRLIFIGCDHIRDSTNKQFAVIQRCFSQLKPQVAFNEGGQINESVHYSSLNKAAFEAGETGCLKYLSDQAGVHLLNGDTPDSLEFALTLKRFPKEEMYLYYVMERIVIPYLSFGNQKESFETYFNDGVKWLVNNDFPLASHEQTFAYFNDLYQKYIKRPFVPALTGDVEKFDYINGGDCHFCALGRQSKMIRDSILLTKLDQALDQYNRIIVTFGKGHALAVKPALIQIMNKDRR
ncbi:hypothetical protein [Spirosoma validum]|uniref:Uncharacterized protein n=1 Tax=Spirosoma validum TaxID=2771355 RepID=A0A927AZ02_9BACT|nr:hypothetical protein [Spirosoma validum]MBD2752383.1 hypothetical protein [Spirosoma validum]